MSESHNEMYGLRSSARAMVFAESSPSPHPLASSADDWQAIEDKSKSVALASGIIAGCFSDKGYKRVIKCGGAIAGAITVLANKMKEEKKKQDEEAEEEAKKKGEREQKARSKEWNEAGDRLDRELSRPIREYRDFPMKEPGESSRILA